LPEHADQPIVIGDRDDALGITPAGSPEAPATKTGSGVFYANVATDTDLFVKPVVGGVESYHVLRSPDSPERLTLHLQLPEGALLVDDGDKGEVVVRGDQAVASISKVLAQDADGRPVPVTTRVDGDGLVLDVPHRAGTYSYPITVDPTYYDYVVECWGWVTDALAACQFDDWEHGDTGYGNSFAGWTFFDNDTDGMHRYGSHLEGTAYLGTGLYFRNSLYNYFRSAPGDKGGQYWFTAPPGVRIFRAAFANLSTDNTAANPTCAYVGIVESTGNWFPWSPHSVGNCAQQTLGETFWACDINCRSSAGTAGNSAVFGVIGQDRWGDYYQHHLGTVVLYMTDDQAPAIRAVDPPAAGEVVSDVARAVTLEWGDYGVGVKRVTFTLDGQPWDAPTVDGFGANYYCANGSGGVTAYTCAHDAWPQLRIGQLAPGTHQIRANVVDVVGHTATPLVLNVQIAGDTTINTDAKAAAFGNALATRADYQALWNARTAAEKNYMMTADDPSFAGWAPRIDRGAPDHPFSVEFSDVDFSAHTADVMWSEGDDPDLSSGVYGSEVDDENSAYRYRRAGGSWTSWASSDDQSFVLTSADAGDQVDVEVVEYDRAGNESTSLLSSLQVPSGPVAHDTQVQVVPVLACIEWCPAAAAGVAAGVSYFWHVNQEHYSWDHVSSNGDIKLSKTSDDSPTFEDAEHAAARNRKRLRTAGRAEAADDGIDVADDEAHHVVAVGAKAARYARWIFYKCGLDPNDWEDNGLWLPKRYHRRMHTKGYYEAINDMLAHYDPTFGQDPCGQSQAGVDLDGQGLRRVMQNLKDYILRGEMP
jgi:hypothetical protein